MQLGNTTYTVRQLSSEKVECNLPVISNNSAIKQTSPIINITYTSEGFTDKVRYLMEYILQEDAKSLPQLITITKDHRLVIDINKSLGEDSDGTALLMAINRQDPEIVQLLLEQPNIDINKTFTYHRAANINGDIYTIHPFLEALTSKNSITNLFLPYLYKIDMVERDADGKACVDKNGNIQVNVIYILIATMSMNLTVYFKCSVVQCSSELLLTYYVFCVVFHVFYAVLLQSQNLFSYYTL